MFVINPTLQLQIKYILSFKKKMHLVITYINIIIYIFNSQNCQTYTDVTPTYHLTKYVDWTNLCVQLCTIDATKRKNITLICRRTEYLRPYLHVPFSSRL